MSPSRYTADGHDHDPVAGSFNSLTVVPQSAADDVDVPKSTTSTGLPGTGFLGTGALIGGSFR
jgi:hypothetical protein